MRVFDVSVDQCGSDQAGHARLWSSHSFAAVVPLLILIPSALLIYVSVVLYAFTR